MVLLDGASLGFDEVAAVARRGAPVRLAEPARAAMARSYAWVLSAARGEVTDEHGVPLPVYGVNTGYGSLARVRIAPENAEALSLSLIRSHAAGVGEPAPADAVRAMMLLRANALAKGASGCRPALVDTLCAMLDADVVPEVPSQGSCGSSGDLAPLAHLGLVVFRGDIEDDASSGIAHHAGVRTSGRAAMAAAGLARLVPGPKEGLAMTNGAQLSTAILALACVDAQNLLYAAEVAAALSFEALRGVTRALDPAVMALRPYRGAIDCASDLRALLAGSTLVDSLVDKVQDAYALRCTPQILGACRDGLRFARAQARVELNAATDNPLILMDAPGPNKAFSAGMFHGEPVGMAADHLKLAASEVAALAERRLFRLTTGTLSSRLPPLLADRPGLGMMVPQSTAAALVSENKALLWPASGDSIPTCEDQEDHVAMATTAARRAAEVVANSVNVVAIELLCASRGTAMRLAEGGQAGVGTRAAIAAIEARIGRGGEIPAHDINALAAAILDGSLVAAVADAAGPFAELG